MISETKRKATWQELADRVDELQEKLDNSISKDKIKEKIEELDKKIKDEYFTHDMYEGTNKVELWWSFQHKKAILEELLKGE